MRSGNGIVRRLPVTAISAPDPGAGRSPPGPPPQRARASPRCNDTSLAAAAQRRSRAAPRSLRTVVFEGELDPEVLALDERDDRLQLCLLYTSPSPRDRTRSRMPS